MVGNDHFCYRKEGNDDHLNLSYREKRSFLLSYNWNRSCLLSYSGKRSCVLQNRGKQSFLLQHLNKSTIQAKSTTCVNDLNSVVC